MKTIFGLLIVALLLGGGFYWWQNQNQTEIEDADNDNQTIEDDQENDEGIDSDEVIQNENIKVTNLKAGDTVSTPIVLEGEARGTWYFEASFPVVVVDWDGKVIGEGYAEAQSDWMTTEFVSFVATVGYDLPADTPYKRGAIILKKDNPSGLPENDDALEIAVNFE